MSSTDPSTADGQSPNGHSPDARTKDEIQADLEQTREHLAETVDALGHKLDVKTRSREKAEAVAQDHGRELVVGGLVVAALIGLLVWRRRG